MTTRRKQEDEARPDQWSPSSVLAGGGRGSASPLLSPVTAAWQRGSVACGVRSRATRQAPGQATGSRGRPSWPGETRGTSLVWPLSECGSPRQFAHRCAECSSAWFPWKAGSSYSFISRPLRAHARYDAAAATTAGPRVLARGGPKERHGNNARCTGRSTLEASVNTSFFLAAFTPLAPPYYRRGGRQPSSRSLYPPRPVPR